MPASDTSPAPSNTEATALPATSLVIPVYNEEESLPALFDALEGAIPALPQPVEVVLVDDVCEDCP